MARHTKATIQALDRIGALDLKEIVARSADLYGWSASQAADAELWYKNFLKLCYLNRRRPVAALDEDADNLWHQHILYTIKYQRDCDALFGGFLNHDPIDGPASAEDVREFKRSMELCYAEYGTYPPKPAFRCVKRPPPPPPPPRKRK